MEMLASGVIPPCRVSRLCDTTALLQAAIFVGRLTSLTVSANCRTRTNGT